MLELGQQAQLHLALWSPVAAVKNNDQRKLSGNLGEPSPLSFMIRQLQVREPLTDDLIHTFLFPSWLITAVVNYALFN